MNEGATRSHFFEVRASVVGSALRVALAVTLAVALVGSLLPERFVALAVASIFFAATWFGVWRRSDEAVVRSGLALGGLVLSGPIRGRRLAKAALRAVSWALLASAVTFGPFWLGWCIYFHPHRAFALRGSVSDVASELFAQLVLIALPEEAFYRGYLQSRLDEGLPGRARFLGADVGPSLVLTSAVFALGHIATVHEATRLAVFFPSLLFGWLRCRTNGIGASLVFHAFCNLASQILAKGYHV